LTVDDTQRIFGSQIPAVKLNYFPDTDSLYIDLAQRPSVESREVSEGVVLDYDGEGNWSELTSITQAKSWIYANSSRLTFLSKQKRSLPSNRYVTK